MLALVLMRFDSNFMRLVTKSEPGAQRLAKDSTTSNTNMSSINLSLRPVAALPVLILCGFLHLILRRQLQFNLEKAPVPDP